MSFLENHAGEQTNADRYMFIDLEIGLCPFLMWDLSYDSTLGPILAQMH